MSEAVYEQTELCKHERDMEYHKGFDAAGGTRAICKLNVAANGSLSCNRCLNVMPDMDLRDIEGFIYCPYCGGIFENKISKVYVTTLEEARKITEKRSKE